MGLIDKLVAIGDGFRSSRGTTQKYTLDEMAVLAGEKTGGGVLATNERVYQVGNAVKGEILSNVLVFSSTATGI